MSATHEPRQASEADVAAIGACLGAAFEDDPVWVWLIGRRRITAARAAVVLGAATATQLDQGLTCAVSPPGVEGTSGAPAVGAAAVWTAPGRYHVSGRRYLPHLPATVRAVGLRAMGRLASMAEVEKMHPREPHYYLAILGTHPAHQGQGLGAAAMAPVLARADEEATGCYLESSKESNLAFYHRFGFEVVGTHDLGKGSGPRIWRMWRDPRTP